MDWHYDIALRAFVVGSGCSNRLRNAVIKRGDTPQTRLFFYRDTLPVGADTIGSPKLVIKSAGGPSSLPLALIDSWEDSDTHLEGVLNLDGENLSTFIGSERAVSLLAELTFEDDGPQTSLLLDIVCENDLWRGDEGSPPRLPNPQAWPDAYFLQSTVVEDEVTGEMTFDGDTGTALNRIRVGAGECVLVDGIITVRVTADFCKSWRVTFMANRADADSDVVLLGEVEPQIIAGNSSIAVYAPTITASGDAILVGYYSSKSRWIARLQVHRNAYTVPADEGGGEGGGGEGS